MMGPVKSISRIESGPGTFGVGPTHLLKIQISKFNKFTHIHMQTELCKRFVMHDLLLQKTFCLTQQS